MSKASGIQMKHNPHSRYFKEFYHNYTPFFIYFLVFWVEKIFFFDTVGLILCIIIVIIICICSGTHFLHHNLYTEWKIRSLTSSVQGGH